jgi:cytoskeleton protein RodZ
VTEGDLRHPGTEGAAPAGPAPAQEAAAMTAGAMLAGARARAGLSIDAVAQQLKLGIRQVEALEDGNFAALPGRTFVRGFVRNYARLMKLDADAVLAALPGTGAAPALEAPSLHETAHSIGELPTAGGHRPGWTRWAIPLTLVAIIAGAAAYEFLRPIGDARRAGTKESPAVATTAPAKPAPESGGVALPNPVPHGDTGNGAPITAPAGAAANSHAVATPAVIAPVPAATVPAAPTPSSPAGGSSAAAPGGSTQNAATPLAPPGAVAPTTGTGPVAGTGEVTLALSYKDASWTEIRDRTGRVLLSRMNEGGQTQTVAGQPPFELTIGNASDVTLRYNGKPVDLAPHTRQNVARLTLP